MGFNISHIANPASQPIPVKDLGLKQVAVTKTVVVSAGAEEPVFTTQKATVIDELIFSTNKNAGFHIRILAFIKGVETPISDVSYDGTGGQGFFAEQMVTHGSAFFNVIEYDSLNNRYKFALKHPLTFAEGVKITGRATSTTDPARMSISVMGREYE